MRNSPARTRAGINSVPSAYLLTNSSINSMKTTKLTSAKLRTQLELGVANDTLRHGAMKLSAAARRLIAGRFLEQAEMLKAKADQLSGSNADYCWLFQDNSIAVIGEDGTRKEVLDECFQEISHISIPGMHYIQYKSLANGDDNDDEESKKDWSSLKVPLFASHDEETTKNHSTAAKHVLSLPVIRVSNGGNEALLSVHIPSGVVQLTNPETGVSKDLDLSNHPIIKSANKQYRIVHTCHPEMLMYYCPVRKLVCDVGESW